MLIVGYIQMQFFIFVRNDFYFALVRLRYQVLDESTLPKKPAELTMYIADASGARIHTWNLGYLQRKENNTGNTFSRDIL